MILNVSFYHMKICLFSHVSREHIVVCRWSVKWATVLNTAKSKPNQCVKAVYVHINRHALRDLPVADVVCGVTSRADVVLCGEPAALLTGLDMTKYKEWPAEDNQPQGVMMMTALMMRDPLKAEKVKLLDGYRFKYTNDY